MFVDKVQQKSASSNYISDSSCQCESMLLFSWVTVNCPNKSQPVSVIVFLNDLTWQFDRVWHELAGMWLEAASHYLPSGPAGRAGLFRGLTINGLVVLSSPHVTESRSDLACQIGLHLFVLKYRKYKLTNNH